MTNENTDKRLEAAEFRVEQPFSTSGVDGRVTVETWGEEDVALQREVAHMVIDEARGAYAEDSK